MDFGKRAGVGVGRKQESASWFVSAHCRNTEGSRFPIWTAGTSESQKLELSSTASEVLRLLALNRVFSILATSRFNCSALIPSNQAMQCRASPAASAPLPYHLKFAAYHNTTLPEPTASGGCIMLHSMIPDLAADDNLLHSLPPVCTYLYVYTQTCISL